MKKAFLILFILVPALISAAIFILPERAVSENENRGLLVKSEISFDIKDGSFQSDLESFLSDQFPFRDTLVYAQSALRYALGQREIGGAYFCKDGRLMQKITDEDIDKNSVFAYADKINRIAEEYPVYVMYVPSAGTVGGEKLPAGAPMYDYDSLYSLLTLRLGNAKCVNLREYLNRADCYYKTDHHWNSYGAYAAYTAFCRMKGEAPRERAEFNLKKVTSDFRGTLYSKAPISKSKDEILLPDIDLPAVTADGENIEFYDLGALKTKDKYNVFQGGNHGITEIKTKSESKKTLLIFKDSFANSFVPYILEDYGKITLVDERYAMLSASDFAKGVKPDEILVLREIIS